MASTIVDSAEREQDISREFTYYTQEAQGLVPVHSEKKLSSLRFGYFSGEKWAGISFANQTDTPLSKLLYFDTLTGRLTLYRSDAGNLVEVATAGSSLPFNDREFKSVFTVFRLTLPAHSDQMFYFKIKSRHNFNSKVFLGNELSLKTREEYKLSFMEFYLGGILCLVLYNFFIFLFLKDKNYFYYCAFASSFIGAILAIHGLLDKYLHLKWISLSHHLICFSAMALFCATLFTYHFLEIPKYLPRYKRFYQLSWAVSLFLFFTGVTPLEDQYPAVFGMMIDLSIVIADAIFIYNSVQLLKQSKMARFYLFSWIIVFISLISWFGMTFGFFPNNFFTQHSLLYANLGQMLTLSLALAFRIHLLTQEKIAAEEKAMQKEKYQRLVRVLSHDIANSLTIINSYSKKLIKPRNLEANPQKAMEKIYIASENIKNILNNVREEELLSVRKKELARELVKVDEVLRYSASVFEDNLKLKNIDLIINVEDNHTVWANKTCFLNNIVNNILSNSIKFSFENSRIDITSSINGDKICLTFTDYGRGVKQDLIKDIFFGNRFISSRGTNAEAGHGFGTTLMREYVELFDGTMEVTSNENEGYTGREGTRICLYFPIVIIPEIEPNATVALG